MEAYTKVDRVESKTEGRSARGYYTMVVRNLVSLKCKNQPVVAKFRSEAKYRAIALGVCDYYGYRSYYMS